MPLTIARASSDLLEISMDRGGEANMRTAFADFVPPGYIMIWVWCYRELVDITYRWPLI